MSQINSSRRSIPKSRCCTPNLRQKDSLKPFESHFDQQLRIRLDRGVLSQFWPYIPSFCRMQSKSRGKYQRPWDRRRSLLLDGRKGQQDNSEQSDSEHFHADVEGLAEISSDGPLIAHVQGFDTHSAGGYRDGHGHWNLIFNPFGLNYKNDIISSIDIRPSTTANSIALKAELRQ